MEDMLANVEGDIVNGAYDIFNRVNNLLLYPRKILLYLNIST